MTYSKCGRLLNVPCLMLMVLLATVGCQGDGERRYVEPPPPDAPPISQKSQIMAAPGTVNLGAVDVGITSIALPVAVTNVGIVPATLIVTPSPAGLIAASGCAGILPAGQSCVLLITATPSSPAPFQGSVTVTAAGGNTLVISVTGVSGPPESLTITPTAVDLGDVAVGTTVSASITLTASGPLTGLTFGVRGADLDLAPATDCQATLAGGASCGIVADFTSATPGTATGNAIYVSHGGITKSVPVSANVLAPASLVAEPRALALTAPPGAPGAAGTIKVGNGGGTATGPIALVLEPPAAPFQILTNACSSGPLRGGDECALTVAYSPAATASTAETATLVISDMGPDASTTTVALTGASNVPGTFVISGGPDLGTASIGQPGGEVTFTVTALSATGVLGRFEVGDPSVLITSNTCKGKSLKSGESCAVGLTLSPLVPPTPGRISTLLTIASDADAPQYIAVTGTILAV